MKPLRLPQISFLLVTALTLLLLSSFAAAQSDTGSGPSLSKSPEAQAFDSKARERLQEMSPQEVEALDKKLAEALTLFYDREYQKALPLFEEISRQVETMDVMFWYGSCAAKAGEPDLAIQKFMRMLEIDPSLHRVRLELAKVHYELGRYDDARRELNNVLEAQPPDTVRQNIEKLLAAIDARTRRLYANIRGSVGLQYDSNVSAGPDKDYIVLPEGRGTLGPLAEDQKKASDWQTVFNLAANALYDVGDPRGFMWNTTGSFYNTHNWEYEQFDYLQWRLTTGPWWAGKRSVLKIPVGYAENLFEHDHLFDTWDISPSYEYFFTPGFSLKGMVTYSTDTYDATVPPDDRSGQDNINRIWEINPNLYFNNRRDVLSFFASHENLNAKDPRWGYEGFNLAASYFKRFSVFNWDMEFYARYKYSRRDYDTAALLWPVQHLRRDKRHNVYAALTRNFLQHYFATLTFNFIDNQSNTELYNYDKNVVGLFMGFKF